MSNTDRKSRIYQGKKLRGKHFHGDLTGSDFSGSDLRGANFTDSTLTDAKFVGADIRSTNFTAVKLIRADFSNAKAGVSPSLIITLLIIIFIIAAICGIFAVVAGNFAAFPFVIGLSNDTFYPAPGLKVYEIITDLSKERVLFSAIAYTVCFLAFINASIYQGFRAALVLMGRVMAIAIPLLLVGAIFGFIIWQGVNENRLLQNLAGYPLAICYGILSFVVAGMLALVVAITLGIVITASEIIAHTRMAMITRILAFGFALIWALFGSLAVAFSVAEAGHGSGASALAVAMSWGSTGLILLLGSYLAQAALSNTETKHKLVRRWAIVFATWKGTTFQDANLHQAIFTNAYLKSTNLSSAKIFRTCWRGTSQLNQTNTYKTYLDQPQVLKLAVTGQGAGQDLRDLNLQGVYLQLADLSGAILVRTQLEGADLCAATLTGACIEDWKINRYTKLSFINCDYVFMRYHNEDKRSRVPTGDAVFKDGEFQIFVRSLLDTLDIVHKLDFDPAATTLALIDLSKEYKESLEIVAIENRDNSILMKVRTSGRYENSLLEEKYEEEYSKCLDTLPKAVKNLSQEEKKFLSAFSDVVQQLKQEINAGLYLNYAAMNIDKSTHFDNSFIGQIVIKEGDIINRTTNVKYGNYNENIYGNYLDHSESISLANVAREIKKILDQLSKTNSTTTASDKIHVVTQAINHIENNPTLKSYIQNALNTNKSAELEQSINHPLSSFIINAFLD